MSANRKVIVFWVGNGNNEPAWAKIISRQHRVLLIQRGLLTQQFSIWENERQIYSSPEKRIGGNFLDQIFFGLISAFKFWRLTKIHTKNANLDLLIVEGARSLAAIFLKRIGRAKAVVAMFNDFLPPVGSLPVRWHRQLNAILCNWAAKNSDEIWRLSPRIPTGQNHAQNFVVPVFINEPTVAKQKLDAIIYVGFPSRDHALEILFDVAKRHQIPLEIVGESPYLESIRPLAPPQTKFHGYVTDFDRIAKIITRCFCGYAIYLNTGQQSYSYYGFASKTFHYLSNDVPVITTNTSFFSAYIEAEGLGHVILPEAAAIEKAILDIRSRPQEFSHRIETFRKAWNTQAVRFFEERMTALLQNNS
jgi:glycosyltransferase involved in cell wall biosynthesis